MSFVTYENFESTSVGKLFYDAQKLQLIVEYKGGTQYRYKDVTIHEWELLCNSSSKGTFINESIKSKPYQKMVLTD